MRHSTVITTRARAMRKDMTGAEVVLWTRLRGRSPERPTFRRQHPMGAIILDFYCPAARLAVEIDGSTHWQDVARARDQARDHWLAGQGVPVLRIPASRVYRDLNSTVDGILRLAEERRVFLAGLAPSTTRFPAGGPPPTAARGR